jgi:hypothetical protein
MGSRPLSPVNVLARAAKQRLLNANCKESVLIDKANQLFEAYADKNVITIGDLLLANYASFYATAISEGRCFCTWDDTYVPLCRRMCFTIYCLVNKSSKTGNLMCNVKKTFIIVDAMLAMLMEDKSKLAYP